MIRPTLESNFLKGCDQIVLIYIGENPEIRFAD